MREQSPEDPVAARTQWTPLVPGGASFITDHLIEESPSRLAMRPTMGMKVFGLAFLLLGLGAIAAGIAAQRWFLTVFALPFVGVGVAVLRHRESVFDGQARSFSGKGRQVVPFGSIHALQLLRERVRGSDAATFDSYELNLVLTTGERINAPTRSG